MKFKNIAVLILIMIAISEVHLSAQKISEGSQELKGPYLGQKPPGKMPEIFGPGIVSTGYFEHSSPAISPDGKEMYWSVHYPENFEHPRPIVFMKIVRNRWTKPRIASFVRKDFRYENPFFSPDGMRIYFSASPVAAKGSESSDIFYVERDKDCWSEQRLAGNPPNSGGMDAQPAISGNGNLYFISYYEKSESKFGLFYSLLEDSKYSPPLPMDTMFNAMKADWTPFIASDESYLIFSSIREGGYGSGDLYISFRKSDGTWGEIINMGSNINTDANERFPIVSPDGRFLFFNSTKGLPGADNKNPGNGLGDIYWVDAAIIDDLKSKQKLL